MESRKSNDHTKGNDLASTTCLSNVYTYMNTHVARGCLPSPNMTAMVSNMQHSWRTVEFQNLPGMAILLGDSISRTIDDKSQNTIT